MKNFTFFCLLFISITSIAQIKQGHFEYNVGMETTDGSDEAEQMVALMKNSTMNLYFAPNKTRMEFKMGEINKLTVIVDRDKNVMLSLSDGYAGKMAILGNPKDQTNEENPDFKITEFDEYKTILGHKCTKYVIFEDGNSTEYWVAKDIIVEIKDQDIISLKLPGFPLAFSRVEDGVKMTFQLIKMEEKLNAPIDSLFSTAVPDGFTVMKGK